jgi:hypothetical protein
MKTMNRGVQILMAALMGTSAAHAAPVCENGSQLWKWVEGRESRVHATAVCTYHGKSVSVDAFGSKVQYISTTESSQSNAEVELRDALLKDCATQLTNSQDLFLDIQLGAELTAPAAQNGETISAMGFIYGSADLSSKQADAIRNRLNAIGSCSTFETRDSNGILQTSNCDQLGMGQSRQSMFSQKTMMAMVIGGFANYIRGGEKPFKMGGDSQARVAASAVYSSIVPIARGHFDLKVLKEMAVQFALGYVAMSLYKTSDFVNGGQSGRHIGTHGVSHAILGGLVYNALYSGIMCRSVECAAEGAVGSTAAYIVDGFLADNSYRLLNQPANAVSEFITGAIIGFLIEHAQEKMENKHLRDSAADAHALMLAKVSAMDLCVDVRDITK